jgi:hypothetical protein
VSGLSNVDEVCGEYSEAGMQHGFLIIRGKKSGVLAPDWNGRESSVAALGESNEDQMGGKRSVNPPSPAW